jgi:hypothetical protein
VTRIEDNRLPIGSRSRRYSIEPTENDAMVEMGLRDVASQSDRLAVG